MKKTERKLKKLTLLRETINDQTKFKIEPVNGGLVPWTCDSKFSCCA